MHACKDNFIAIKSVYTKDRSAERPFMYISGVNDRYELSFERISVIEIQIFCGRVPVSAFGAVHGAEDRFAHHFRCQ